MSEPNNQREWTRINQVLEVAIRIDDGDVVSGTTRNISANGVLVDTDASLAAGASGDVTLTRSDGDAGFTIAGRGTVVRQDDAGVAIRLVSLIGAESYAHLKNLILYNAADDVGQADREFRDHIGLERPQP